MFGRMLKKVIWFVFIFCLVWMPDSNISPFVKGQVQASQDNPPPIGSHAKALVTGIRYWSSAAYTRVVIDLDGEVAYKDHLLREDIVLQKPPRLYIDLEVARLSSHLKQPIPIGDGLLRMARAGQYAPDIVRVVLDLESIIDYRIFSLTDPFRVVIDVMGTSVTTEKQQASQEVSQHPAPQKPPPIRVVIDPGHGGEDPGAIGPTGLKEKDVVLKIAETLGDKIRRELGWEVVMTRQDDRFIPLEERTAIANKEDGDLFLSIHANASTDRRICGIESYALGTTTDKDALRLAARENRISPQKVSDLQIILADLKLNDPTKVSQSSNLADCVQETLTSRLQEKYEQVRDLGVKQAPFVVLMGADMPSILIEVSFISNPLEENRLRNSRYLDELASAIFDGLRRYVQDTKMVESQLSRSISTALSSN